MAAWLSRNWLVLIVGFVAGLLGGILLRGSDGPYVADKYKHPYPFGAPRPIWLAPDNCRKPTAEDIREQDAAMRAVEDFPNAPRHFIAYAALSVLTQPWAPAERVLKEIGMLCPPTRLVDRMEIAAERHGTFRKAHRLYDYDLRLARALGPRNKDIVRAVAETAFSEHVMLDSADMKDVRPFARLILAEFGASAAAPWRERARKEMSAETSLGTGAAQIAASGGEPSVLSEVEKLMVARLADIPKDDPISRLDRDRLYELAYALGMAGPKAAPFSRGLVELLERKVVSAAPPFGGIAAEPRRMCWVADRIGGQAAARANAKEFCRTRWALSEQ